MMADEAKDAMMDDEGDSDVDMGADSGSDAGIPSTAASHKGKGKGKGKAKVSAQGSSTRNKLPYWKRVNKRATDLYSLSLSAVAASPKTVLKKWPATQAEEQKLLLSHGAHRKRDDMQLKQDIITATLKAGTLGPEAIDMKFFSKDMTSLSLRDGPTLSSEFAVSIVQRCSSLQSIDVSSCFLIMDGDVEAMLKACPGLRTIKLRGCRMISDKAIDAMIQHGPSLERVDIGGCFNITFEGTYKLITTHPNISHFLGLDISGTRFTDEAVVEVAKRCPKLLELGVGYSELSNDTFSLVCDSCRLLRHVRIHWCQQLGDACIGELANMLDLEIVDMKGTRGVTAMAITHLVNSRAYKRTEPDAQNRNLKRVNAKYAAAFDPEISESIADLHPTLEFLHT